MNIIARLTKDAVIKNLKDGRQVVEFSVALNNYYKPKGSEKGISTAVYFNCSYWLSTKIAGQLTKGTLVELHGRLTVNTYTDLQGNPKASLNFHVNNIQLHFGKATSNNTSLPEASTLTEPLEDLPF
jgi:single-strand DNA-binding protein